MCIFGMVDAAEMRLSEIGRTVDSCWNEIPKHFQVSLDQWIVMPNHLRGIIIIADETPLPTADALPLRPALGPIAGAFKSAATKRVNAERRIERSPLWQRNFYEHVIRNEAQDKLVGVKPLGFSHNVAASPDGGVKEPRHEEADDGNPAPKPPARHDERHRRGQDDLPEDLPFGRAIGAADLQHGAAHVA